MTATGIKVKSKAPLDDKIFYSFVNVFLLVLLIITLYPLVFILSSSFSEVSAVSSGRVVLLPVGFSIEGYTKVFEHPDIIRAYANTFYYTAFGTLINIVITILAAYPLSRFDLKGRNWFMLLFTITMLFHGGMIPNYILIRSLGMINTQWAMLIPGALSVYNMIIARTFFQSNIPTELLEATQIDGCNDYTFVLKFVLPLSKAVIAVLVIFYAVGHWNSFFNAFLYLNDKKLFPLQIVLRDILISNQITAAMIEDPETALAKQGLAELLKYSLMVVSMAPIIALYPFAQKYFVKGVMIGSIKG